MEADGGDAGIYHGKDDLRLLRGLPGECVDLVYLDPPVFSSWVHQGSWAEHAEEESSEDRWQGGVRAYLDWIACPLQDLHRILKPTGALILVCDEGVGLYVRLLLDELFSQRDPSNRMVWWKANSRSKHHHVFYYRRSGTSATRHSPCYTVIRGEGKDDSSLVAFSFVQGRRKGIPPNQVRELDSNEVV
jgi:hypothetical protein